ncbi:MAG: fumarylacetoacetate hydrolase family protein [Chloroflexota bacterium]
MRVLMYRHEGVARVGVLQGDDVIDLQALSRTNGSTIGDTMLAFIESGEARKQRVELLLRDHAGSQHRTPKSDVEILAPLNPPSGNVICIGRNYAEHAAESARARGEEVTPPTVFTKAQTSINNPCGDVQIDPAISTQVDWEAELGVVIGTCGLNIALDDALDHVYGYTVINDVSARDVQFGWGGQYFKGKSLDGYCPIGPWIVTADEVPDPQNLRVILRVNGEIKQDANTADMIFSVAELISQLSQGMTLRAGTVIATGTPVGVGFARTPPEYLKPGDIVETEIEGIGVLRNRMVNASGA